MGKLSTILGVVILSVIVGAGAFLATWDIPAPSKQVEIVLDNDRFPR